MGAMEMGPGTKGSEVAGGESVRREAADKQAEAGERRIRRGRKRTRRTIVS